MATNTYYLHMGATDNAFKLIKKKKKRKTKAATVGIFRRTGGPSPVSFTAELQIYIRHVPLLAYCPFGGEMPAMRNVTQSNLSIFLPAVLLSTSIR